MSSTTITIRVKHKAKKRLEKLAKNTGRSHAFLVADALNEYFGANKISVRSRVSGGESFRSTTAMRQHARELR